VTSREGIFERALAEDTGLREFTVNLKEALRTARPGSQGSYDENSRHQVFRKYIDFLKPTWANNDAYIAQVAKLALGELYAPHTIEVFIRRTRAIGDDQQIQAAIVGQPKEFIQIYVQEIVGLPRTHQLFLILVSILERAAHLVEIVYSYMLSRLDRKFAFEKHGRFAYDQCREECRLLGLVEVISYLDTETYDFAHPIYGEATEEFIAQHAIEMLTAVLDSLTAFRTDYLKRIIQFFTRRKRSQKGTTGKGLLYEKSAPQAPASPKQYWSVQPEPNDEYLMRNDHRMLLRRMAEIIIAHYDEMPADLQRRLPILAKDPNKWMRERIIRAIGENLHTLPGSIQQMLVVFANDKVARIRRALIETIGQYYLTFRPIFLCHHEFPSHHIWG
jgi:hypothetical protein